MAPVRFGVLGTGNIGKQHIALLRSGDIHGAVLTATASRSGEAVDSTTPHFQNLDALLDAQLCDVLLIATPTMSHVEAAQSAMDRGVHVLLEKPLAMSVLQSQSLINNAPTNLQFSVMLNQRFHPAYATLKRLLDEGVIGAIQRYSWTMTSWYRPDIYYQVSSWRGTWPGEGGGLLINQCIHNLDILQWLFGLPESLVSNVAFGRYHQIDVEDEATAVLRHHKGMTGLLQASSGEAPGINRLEIIGDYGSLTWNDSQIILSKSDQSVSEHCATTHQMFGMPSFSPEVVALPESTNQHAQVLQNMTDTVAGNAQLLTPATEGIGSLQLANAILLSEWTGEMVNLPIDAARYESLLREKIEGSSLRAPADTDVEIDMEKSFR